MNIAQAQQIKHTRELAENLKAIVAALEARVAEIERKIGKKPTLKLKDFTGEKYVAGSPQ